VPWLEAAGWLVLEPIVPDVEPMAELRRVFRNLFDRSRDKHWVNEKVNENKLEEITQKLDKNKSFLLIVDQLEQLFTVAKKK
jgi:hypothetical protein